MNKELKSILTETAKQVRAELPFEEYYSEAQYQTVFVLLLQKRLPEYHWQKEVIVPFRLKTGETFGFGRADVVGYTESTVIIIELKAHSSDRGKTIGQLTKYIKHYNTLKDVFGGFVMWNRGVTSQWYTKKVLMEL